jgi:hypothetical protein
MGKQVVVELELDVTPAAQRRSLGLPVAFQVCGSPSWLVRPGQPCQLGRTPVAAPGDHPHAPCRT